MTTDQISKRDFLQFVFDRATYEQDELVDRWKQLDTKAQATTTIAGVFIAAAFAFVRNTGAQPLGYQKWMFATMLISLAATIGFAIFTMLIRTISLPLTTEEVAKMIKDVLEMPSKEFERRYEGLLVDTMDRWINALNETHGAVTAKARHLMFAQYSLLCSVGLALLLILLVIFM